MTQARPFYRSSTFYVFVGLLLGIVFGGFLPSNAHPTAYNLFRFCSKAFIALIKGLIVPLLFSTIVVGVAQTGDIKAVGRIGGKALLYFEVVTTLALAIGLAFANWVRPGAGLPLHADSAVELAKPLSGWEIALHLFPSNLIEHAAKGDILPVVVFATLFGISLARLGERGRPLLGFFELTAETMFKYTDMVMKLTPLGVFGAMAYNVSSMAAGHTIDGVQVAGWPAVFSLLRNYALLVASLYGALLVLFVCVFVPVMWLCRIRVLQFLSAIREPAKDAVETETFAAPVA